MKSIFSPGGIVDTFVPLQNLLLDLRGSKNLYWLYN